MRQISTLILCLIGLMAMANDEAGLFYSSGKIYVVVGVVLIIFAGIIAYLVRLEKKIKRLEDHEA
ncbi:MAG: CcmD family protein [Bacteroidia bacterium]